MLSSLSYADKVMMYVDTPGKALTGKYVILDASLQLNITDIKLRMAAALQKAEGVVNNMQYKGESESAIIVAFTTLFIATVTIPQHWNEAIQKRVYQIMGLVPALLNHKVARVAYVGVCRMIASAIVVGPALFSFLTVVARDQGMRIADGYPTIAYQALPKSAGLPCTMARIGETPAFGIAETVVLETAVQTWAVVLVCCLSLVALLAATGMAMWSAASDDPAGGSRPNAVDPGAAQLQLTGGSALLHGVDHSDGQQSEVLRRPSLGLSGMDSLRMRNKDCHREQSAEALGAGKDIESLMCREAGGKSA